MNDTEGHRIGDQILEALGAAVLASIREIDIPCRAGGDEFCIILPRTPQDKCSDIIERIVAEFQNRENKGVTFSVGVATTGREEFVEAEELVKIADCLMYVFKEKSA